MESGFSPQIKQLLCQQINSHINQQPSYMLATYKGCDWFEPARIVVFLTFGLRIRTVIDSHQKRNKLL